MNLFEMFDDKLLKEDKELEQYFKGITDHCQQYLKEINGDVVNNILYRGMDGMVKSAGLKNARLKDRKPSASGMHAHMAFNEYFTEKFNKPFRNGVFSTGHKYIANSYGETYAIFPVDGYEYLWNTNIQDLFNDTIDLTNPSAINNWADFAKNNDLNIDATRYDSFDEFIDDVGFVRLSEHIGEWIHNQHLVKALDKGSEVMLWTDNYFYVPVYSLVELKKWIN